MKKLKYLAALLTVLLLTGCIKYNGNMVINKDKSMELSFIYAIDESLVQDQKLLEDKDRKVIENKGYTITDYNENGMVGNIISKKVDNIDEISASRNIEYDLSGILDEKSDEKYIFNVKKGLLKNTYTAKFKFAAEESNMDSSDDSIEYDGSSNDGTSGNLEDLDFSKMMSKLDLSFNVSLPYKAISNNANKVSNEGKDLNWSLLKDKSTNIDFEFELYNWANIYFGIGIIVLIFLIVILSAIGNSKSKKTVVSSNNEQVNNVQPVNNIAPINNQPINPQPLQNNQFEPPVQNNNQVVNNPVSTPSADEIFNIKPIDSNQKGTNNNQ